MTIDHADGPGASARPADGEPALFLVESLIHELVARNVFDSGRAAEIVTLALEAQVSSCDDRGEDEGTSAAVAALSRIRATFALDLPSEPPDCAPPAGDD